jgi:hypothetical protein
MKTSGGSRQTPRTKFGQNYSLTPFHEGSTSRESLKRELTLALNESLGRSQPVRLPFSVGLIKEPIVA